MWIKCSNVLNIKIKIHFVSWSFFLRFQYLILILQISICRSFCKPTPSSRLFLILFICFILKSKKSINFYIKTVQKIIQNSLFKAAWKKWLFRSNHVTRICLYHKEVLDEVVPWLLPPLGPSFSSAAQLLAEPREPSHHTPLHLKHQPRTHRGLELDGSPYKYKKAPIVLNKT